VEKANFKSIALSKILIEKPRTSDWRPMTLEIESHFENRLRNMRA